MKIKLCNEPISQPLKSLTELLNWKPLGKSEYSSRIALTKKIVKDYPKTLVCHDMAGGYLDDKYCQGVKCYDCYTFNYWPYIDGFIYFSHNFITIPPLKWIDSAHINGVPIYGTFITEGEDGYKICEEILISERMVEKVADLLINIAVFFNFNGWLLNIENEIKDTNIELLTYFVTYLTKHMHIKQHNSKIIWYDSVTIEGKLKWQNELNEKNMPFFISCDGIFLNYVWKAVNLSRSVDNYARMVTDWYDYNLTSPRACSDIYAGIDVFGRGMIGDGGFNTKVAIDIAREYKVSLAIFAPAWTYEKFDRDEWKCRDEEFWSSLTLYLYPDNYTFTTLPLIYNMDRKFEFSDRSNPSGTIQRSTVDIPINYLSNNILRAICPLFLPFGQSSPTLGYGIHAQNNSSVAYTSLLKKTSNGTSGESLIPLYVTHIELEGPVVDGEKSNGILIYTHVYIPTQPSPNFRNDLYLGVKYRQMGDSVHAKAISIETPLLQHSMISAREGKYGVDYVVLENLEQTVKIKDKRDLEKRMGVLKCEGKKFYSIRTLSLLRITIALNRPCTITQVYLRSSQGPIDFVVSTIENDEGAGGQEECSSGEGLLFVMRHFYMGFKAKHPSSISSLVSEIDSRTPSYHFGIDDYHFSSHSPTNSTLKLYLRWHATHSLAPPSHLVYRKVDNNDNCPPLELQLDAEGSYSEGEHHLPARSKLKVRGELIKETFPLHFALFTKMAYKIENGADEVALNETEWRFVDITTRRSYYLVHDYHSTDGSLMPRTLSETLKILIHPLQTACFTPKEPIDVSQSSTIEIVLEK